MSACARWSRNNLESESSEEARVTLLDGFLQFEMKHFIHARVRSSVEKDEWRVQKFQTEAGAVMAVSITILVPGKSRGGDPTPDGGHWDSERRSHAGPCHQRSDSVSFIAVVSLLASSAGLSAEATWRHELSGRVSCMRATRWEIKVSKVQGIRRSQWITISESVHGRTFWREILSVLAT